VRAGLASSDGIRKLNVRLAEGGVELRVKDRNCDGVGGRR